MNRIRFQNGFIEFFDNKPLTKDDFRLPDDTLPQKTGLGRNTLWFNAMELMVFRFNLILEHTFGKKNQWSVRIPFSASLKDKKVKLRPDGIMIKNNNTIYVNTYRTILPDLFDELSGFTLLPNMVSQISFYNNFGNSFYTGLGIRNYFGGLKARNFFVGAEVDFGTFVYKYQVPEIVVKYGYYSSGDYIRFSDTQGAIGGMIRALVEIGGRWNPSPKFSMSLSTSIGYINLISKLSPISYNFRGLSFNPQFSLGYSFGKTSSQ